MMNDTACATVIGPSKSKWTLWSDEDTIANYAVLARLHTRLAPYFQLLAAEAHRSGRPLMLHPWLLFPQSPQARAIDDAFFLGPALFAAPVVRRGQSVKRIWLPPGTYVDLRDDSIWRGGATVELPAPLGQLPLLLAAGEILPLLDASVETLAPASDPGVISAADRADVLDVKVALAPGQSAQLALADGTLLSAARGDDAGNPAALVPAADLGACAVCFADQPPHLRVNGALAATSDLTFGQLRLHADGPAARRIRWDVFQLP
jgi:hypothetical protein